MTDDLADAIAAIVDHLQAAGVEFMIVGSVAALAHGRARSTQDFDLVVHGSRGAIAKFVRSLPPDRFYASPEAAMEAVDHTSMFNVLDMHSGWKADIIVRKDREFSRTEFGRRTETTVFGRALPVATVEDTIVAKLEWAQAGGGSARQLEDVRELVVLAGRGMDRDYVLHWVDALGLREMWHRATGPQPQP